MNRFAQFRSCIARLERLLFRLEGGYEVNASEQARWVIGRFEGRKKEWRRMIGSMVGNSKAIKNLTNPYQGRGYLLSGHDLWHLLSMLDRGQELVG